MLALLGDMRWQGFKASLIGTANTTGMIFLVLLGADLLNSALALTQMPAELADWVKDSGFPPMLVLASIFLIYVLLGCVMDSLAMILLRKVFKTPAAMATEARYSTW